MEELEDIVYDERQVEAENKERSTEETREKRAERRGMRGERGESRDRSWKNMSLHPLLP